MVQWPVSVAPALAHGILLLGLLWWGLSRQQYDRGAAICAVFVLGWTDLVGTAFLLGALGRLDDRWAYVGVSLALACGLGLLLRMPLLTRASPNPAADQGPAEDRSPTARFGRALLWLVILAVVLPTAIICAGYDPNNFDSVAYRLPRAFLYIGQGTLRHVGGGDFRMQYYPFNMTLAYVAFVIHGLAGPWLNAFSFVAWLVGGIAVNRTAREYGAGRTAALFAAAMYMTTPAVLVSASSTNDDMIAGVPLLIGVLFATRWYRSAQLDDAAMAAMAIGLSAGSKLHYPFLLPVAVLLAFTIIHRLFTAGALGPFLRRRWLHVAVVLCIVAVLALPALLINVLEKGRATPDLPNYVNKPFSLVAAGTTSLVTSASLFLAPFPDLDLDPDTGRRQALYTSFNAWQNHHLFSWVSPDLNYSDEPYYRFEGVASNDAYMGLWEQSAWIGFMPWLLLLVLAVAWTKGTSSAGRLRVAALWLVAAFFTWHLARCFILKYVGAAGIYYAYAAILGAPALAWLWDAALPDRRRLRLGLRTACVLGLGTNLVSAANAFAYNQQRNLPELFQAKHFRPRQGVVGPTFTGVLKAAHHIYIGYTQWEMPLLDLMSVHPTARYTLSGTSDAAPVPGYDLSFMLQRTLSQFGDIPLQFTNDDRPRFAMLGVVMTGWGQQHAFGHGVVPAPMRPAGIVADYHADIDEGDLNLTSGWFATEHTHRWSSGSQSLIDFDLSRREAGCRLDMTLMTSGPQRVSVALNGRPAGSFSLDSALPGEDRSVPVPDAAIQTGLNRFTLGFDNAHADDGDSRLLAIGLIKAALICDRLTGSSANGNAAAHPPETASRLPLTKQGFAILGIDEQRDSRGGLTAIKIMGISGSAANEYFDVALSLISSSGAAKAITKPQPIRWSQWIPIPDAPLDGRLEIALRRIDRPNIEARAQIPIATATSMGLDLRPQDVARP